MEEMIAIRKMFAAKLFIHASDYALGIYAESLPRKKEREIVRYNELKRNENRAKKWFFDDNDNSPASFKWVCDLLDIDYKKTRSKIQSNWRIMLHYNVKGFDEKNIANEISAFGNVGESHVEN